MDLYLKEIIGMNKLGVMAIVIEFYTLPTYILFFFLELALLWVSLYFPSLFLLKALLVKLNIISNFQSLWHGNGTDIAQQT